MAFRLYVYNVLSLVSRFLFTQASDVTTVVTDVCSLSLFAFQLTDNIASDLLFIPLMDLVEPVSPPGAAAVALTQTRVLFVD